MKIVSKIFITLTILFIGCTIQTNQPIEFSFIPGEIPFNQPFDVSIKLDTTYFKNIDVKKLNFEAIMPSHGHGMNVQPIITKGKKGNTFLAKGLIFHMRGDWQIQVYIDHKGKIEKASVDVKI